MKTQLLQAPAPPGQQSRGGSRVWDLLKLRDQHPTALDQLARLTGLLGASSTFQASPERREAHFVGALAIRSADDIVSHTRQREQRRWRFRSSVRDLGQIPARKKSGHPVRGKTLLHCGDQAQRRPTGASRRNRSASADASRNPQLVQRFHHPLGFLAQLGKGDRHLFGRRASIETISHQPRQVPNFLSWTRRTEEFQIPFDRRGLAGRRFAREQNAPPAGQRAFFTGRVPLQNIQRAKRCSAPFQNRQHLVNR